MKHIGLNINRLQHDHNWQEKIFCDQWQKENDQGSILQYILGKGNKKDNPTVRDIQVAATVIQWLGTCVGQSFLRKVNEQLQIHNSCTN